MCIKLITGITNTYICALILCFQCSFPWHRFSILCTICSFIVYAFKIDDTCPLIFVGQDPIWGQIATAIGLFIYQTLDAIDGKQARRTNSSSPLGELFDHGCDGVSTGT